MAIEKFTTFDFGALFALPFSENLLPGTQPESYLFIRKYLYLVGSLGPGRSYDRVELEGPCEQQHPWSRFLKSAKVDLDKSLGTRQAIHTLRDDQLS